MRVILGHSVVLQKKSSQLVPGLELGTLSWYAWLLNTRLRVALGGVRDHRRSFALTETLNSIETSRTARLDKNQDTYRVLSRRTRTLLRRDKERYVRSLKEDVEGYLDPNDFQPVYRALKKLRSMSTTGVSAIRIADDCLVSDVDGQMACWAEYFEQLFTVNPPIEHLCVLMERWREFRQGMFAAYVDLKKTFSLSASKGALWFNAPLRDSCRDYWSTNWPTYTPRLSVVKCGGLGWGVFSFFLVNMGVRQGCVLAPSLFNTYMG